MVCHGLNANRSTRDAEARASAVWMSWRGTVSVATGRMGASFSFHSAAPSSMEVCRVST